MEKSAESLKDFSAASFPKDILAADSCWPTRIFLCLAVLGAYSSVWPNVFLFDDRNLIVLNKFFKNWSSLPQLLTSLNYAGVGMPGGFYRPVPAVAHFFTYQAFGLSTVAFHALNLILQAFNACLLHHFGVRAGFKKGAALAAALLWAVHPLHTVDVAYMSATPELLWSSFTLLGLIALLPDFTPKKIWTAMIFFILALGCKEIAVVFPALAATTFFFASKERTQVSAYLRMWPLWLLSAVYVAAWLWYIHTTGYTMDKTGDPVYFKLYTSNLPNRILTSLATLPVYARLILWPAGLHIERLFPIFAALSGLALAGALMAGLGLLQVLRGRARRGLGFSFGLLWFAIALSPATGIVFPIDAPIHDGWMYLPMMGLFLGMMQTAAGFFEKKQNMARGIVLVLAVSLGVATFLQAGVWRNLETLYQNIERNAGRLNRLNDATGMFYMQRGEFDKAIEMFKRAIADPGGRAPNQMADTHLRLGIAWIGVRANENESFTMVDIVNALPSCKHIAEAISELNKAIEVDPEGFKAHVILGAVHHYQGDDAMAVMHQQEADRILQKLRNPAP